MRKMIVMAAIAACLPGMAAASNCAERAHITDRLAEKFGEAFAGGGLQGSDVVIEVWASPERGTWTILMTRASGVSCIVATGTDWLEGTKTGKVAGIPG